MNAYCPECETDLDQTTGICPACRWDPLLSTETQTEEMEPEPQLSLTERYRGSDYDLSVDELAMDPLAAGRTNSGVSRGRAFVIVSLIAGSILYGIGLAIVGPF